MTPAKEEIIEIIKDQPDDTSYVELLRELAFNRMVDRGLNESRERITNKEVH